jgi:hypothetical protein
MPKTATGQMAGYQQKDSELPLPLIFCIRTKSPRGSFFAIAIDEFRRNLTDPEARSLGIRTWLRKSITATLLSSMHFNALVL